MKLIRKQVAVWKEATTMDLATARHMKEVILTTTPTMLINSARAAPRRRPKQSTTSIISPVQMTVLAMSTSRARPIPH